MKKSSDYQYLISDLDNVLTFLATEVESRIIRYSDIVSQVKERRLIRDRVDSIAYIRTIILKFIGDGYLRPFGSDNAASGIAAALDAPQNFQFQISWDGIYFIQTGGYQHTISEKNRLSSLEKKVKTIAIAAFVLSLLTALFAGITLALKIWEDFYRE